MGEFTPDEPPSVLFAERAWLQGALLTAVAYGMEVILFAMSFYLLFRQSRVYGSSDKKKKLFLLVYITIMFILSTLFYASNARYTQLAFIDNRNIPGGPNEYELSMFSIPIDELGNVCAIMTTWLCDALIVWRCQIIYSASKYPLWAIMLFPYILFLGTFVMGLLFLLQVSAASPWAANSSINWTIPFFSLSLSLNIILTAAIVLRLLVQRRRINTLLGPSYGKHYTSVASMVVESASIFSVFSLLFLVPFALNHPLNLIFFQALSVVQIVAMLLIVFRVAQGKGWTSELAHQAVNSIQNQSIRFVVPPSSTVLESQTQTKDSKLNSRTNQPTSGANDIKMVSSLELLEKTGSMA